MSSVSEPVIPSAAAVADLRRRLVGQVFLPGEPGYSDATAPWDASVSIASPLAAIAGSAGDIAVCARWAADHGLDIAVLNTGHGIRDDGHGSLLINTGGLAGVEVHPATRIATVQVGARWADVQAKVTPRGQTGLCGATPGVGVVGYTVGGGLSPIGRTFGMAADRVRRLTVLDANYDSLEVTAESDPDLFWALCGGGGLGLVTELEFETVDLPVLFGGGVYFAGVHAHDVLTAYRDWVATLDDRTSTSIALLHLPPSPALPEFLRGQHVVHLRIAHIDPQATSLETAGRSLLAPMLAAAPALNDYTRPMTPDQLPDIHRDPVAPMPVTYRGGGRDDLGDDAIAAVVAAADPGRELVPGIIEIHHLGGAMAHPLGAPNSATARRAAFHLWASILTDPARPEQYRLLVDGIIAQAGARSSESQLSLYGPDAEPGDVLRLWSDTDAARIRAAATRLDPDGRIRTGRTLTPVAPACARKDQLV